MSTGGDAATQAERVGDTTNADPVNIAVKNVSSELLPTSVKRRVKALKCLQLETTKLEAQFYEEVQQLEVKYHKLYSPHYEKRAKIVRGNYEPNDDECTWDLDSDESESEDAEDGAADGKKKDKENKTAVAAEKKDGNEGEKTADKESKDKATEDVKGIPDFWLTVFKNVSIIEEMIQECDEPILKHLLDVKILYDANPLTFTIQFLFTPNEFFTNTELTKRYEMKCVPDPEDPFSFEGPEIYKSTGCEINWKKGMDVTVKMVKKRQKHKTRGVVRTVVRPVQNESFFNFFSPPELPEDPDAEVDEDTYADVTADIEVGHMLRDRVVPRAVLYFTGEADDDETDDDLSSSSTSIEYSEEADEEHGDGDEEEVSQADDESETGKNASNLAAGDKGKP